MRAALLALVVLAGCEDKAIVNGYRDQDVTITVKRHDDPPALMIVPMPVVVRVPCVTAEAP